MASAHQAAQADRPAPHRRNVTLALPEELLKRARVLAAQRDTSLTSLVEEYLARLLERENDYDRVWDAEIAAMKEDSDMRVGEITWTRDDLHDRSR